MLMYTASYNAAIALDSVMASRSGHPRAYTTPCSQRSDLSVIIYIGREIRRGRSWRERSYDRLAQRGPISAAHPRRSALSVP